MAPFHEVAGLLDGAGEFQLSVRGTTAVVRQDGTDAWVVLFEGEIGSEPGVLDWVSDEVPTLVSRMLDAWAASGPPASESA